MTEELVAAAKAAPPARTPTRTPGASSRTPAHQASNGTQSIDASTGVAAPRWVVLVVDDDWDTLRSLKLLLERLLRNVRVQVADSAPKALALVQEETPDLIITDYQMPGMSGVQLLERLRHAGWQIPSVMITGHCSAPLEQRDWEPVGLLEILHKPVDPLRLAKAVEGTLLSMEPAS